MKRIVLNLILLIMVNVAFTQSNNTVNAIIGDRSFVDKYSVEPNETTDEVLRLQTHLSYVEQYLSSTDVSHLNNAQKEKRALIIQLLHEYWTNGVFPKNYDYEERRPCFIDRVGNICAVGYLIEKTEGREVAEMINQKHQYDYLLDMNETVINKWANEYGLSLEECAMIQPAYGPVQPAETYNVPVKSSYAIPSVTATGINVGVSLINLSSRYSSRSKTIGYLGLLTGTTQIVLGLTNIKKDEQEFMINGPSRTISHRQQNSISYINIATGTTTVITSAFNLLLSSHTKNKRNSVALYSYPNVCNKLTTGLSITRSL